MEYVAYYKYKDNLHIPDDKIRNEKLEIATASLP